MPTTAGAQAPLGQGGQMTPQKFTWWSDMVFLDFLERNIFWYTGQLILSKIFKIVATSRQILRLKCTKFDFGIGGAYSGPQTSQLDLRRPPRNVAPMILTPTVKNSSRTPGQLTR